MNGEAEGFLTKEQIISMGDLCLCIIIESFLAEGEKLCLTGSLSVFQKRFKAIMMPDVNLIPVVQSGSREMLIVHLKP